MQKELSTLELLEENDCLSLEQLQQKVNLIHNIMEICEDEELYWFKRSHEKWLLEGDNNTEFFHRVANGRKRRKQIISLDNEGTLIEGNENLIAHATQYYKLLFGPAPGNLLPIDPNLWSDDEKVSELENNLLTQPFTEAEVKHALFQMEKNKAAGPDKIPIEFYQCCWDIIKQDIMELFEEFYDGSLDVCRLNYGILTLLPKVQDAAKIQQFRPICLLNCLYKWITKVLTIRLETLTNRLILQTQAAFLKGRNIMNGVLALHEILHDTKMSKMVGVVLKLDFEKAYDKVNWAFLFDCLKNWGFNDKWCLWINKVVTRGTVCVKINDQEGPYFVSHKGVRQGDPFARGNDSMYSSKP